MISDGRGEIINDDLQVEKDGVSQKSLLEVVKTYKY